MKIGQYCQRQRCRHVELEQFWQAFASRGFVSDSWAFLFTWNGSCWCKFSCILTEMLGYLQLETQQLHVCMYCWRLRGGGVRSNQSNPPPSLRAWYRIVVKRRRIPVASLISPSSAIAIHQRASYVICCRALKTSSKVKARQADTERIGRRFAYHTRWAVA